MPGKRKTRTAKDVLEIMANLKNEEKKNLLTTYGDEV